MMATSRPLQFSRSIAPTVIKPLHAHLDTFLDHLQRDQRIAFCGRGELGSGGVRRRIDKSMKPRGTTSSPEVTPVCPWTRRLRSSGRFVGGDRGHSQQVAGGRIDGSPPQRAVWADLAAHSWLVSTALGAGGDQGSPLFVSLKQPGYDMCERRA